MRVGISMLTLIPGVSGGSENYARELVRALGRVGRHEYRLYLPTIAVDVEGLPSEVVDEYRASRSMRGRLRAMGQASAFGGSIRRRFRALDAVHFPLSVMIPPVRRVPAVTTVLDVQHELLPEFFSPAERVYRRIVYGWTVRQSRLVVTISHHAAATIVEHLQVKEERVRPIYFGIDHDRFFPGSDARGEFLLYPALGWPHKNHGRLFEAMAILRSRYPGLELVLTGYEGPVPAGVRTVGRVPSDELVRLYRQAAAVVFPSLYEGFGQPPLEAMACGCPVACSNAASLPEVCGDAARLFDPTSVEEMAAAVEEVLESPAEWGAKGLARAAEFTWEATARAHDDVYAELAA
ncbi:MAG: glycosyltransferase family 4 protein [Actinobacteria bacterium]|nr:MAG: glycosyltransferase family 4 protein [Actinomycetota bacterium]